VNKKYRVLSLDGGGVRGDHEIMILEEIEKEIRHHREKKYKDSGKKNYQRVRSPGCFFLFSMTHEGGATASATL